MDGDVRVITWNVFHCRDEAAHGPHAANGHAHVNRKHTAHIAAVLRGARPDVVMLQEVPPLAIPELVRGSGMRGAWWVRTGPLVGGVALRGRLGRANPDLWRTLEGNANVVMLGPRLRAAGAARHVRLNPPARAVPAAVRRGLAPREVVRWLSEPRRAVALPASLDGGAPVWLACVHAHGAATTWQAHMELGRLGDWLGRLDGPLVLGGDLNATPAHPAMHHLAAAGLDVAPTDPAVLIDRILVRGLPVVGPERCWNPRDRTVTITHRGAPRTVRLSDHDPVELVVRVNGSGAAR